MLESQWVIESLGVRKWHLVIGNDEKTDSHVWVLQLHRLQAFYFVMVGKCLNLRLELHTPPRPLLITARKMPFFPWEDIRGMVTPVTSTIPSLCILPPNNYSTLAHSSLQRTPPVWYGPMSRAMGTALSGLCICWAEASGFASLCLIS